MKQLLTFLFLCLCVSTEVSAQRDAVPNWFRHDTIVVDGIYYLYTYDIRTTTFNGNKDQDEAHRSVSVIQSLPSSPYSGSVVIPPSFTYKDNVYDVTGIGDYAFRGCSGLTAITIPNSVTTIGYLAFAGCCGLTSITIPNSVTTIDAWAFEGCSGLTSITIPDSVVAIYGNVFADCNNLTIITVSDGNPEYDSRNNCNAIIETADNRLIVGCQNTLIPDNVISIESSAFSGCSGLTAITIPNSVTTIDAHAFRYCI